MTSKLLCVLVVFALPFLLVKCIADSLSLPVVSIDINSGACVRIEAQNDNFTCNELPSRYVTQFVDEATDDIYRAPTKSRTLVAEVQP